MESNTKIFLGIAVPLLVLTAYWFIIRNRQPQLNVDETDWINNLVKLKFGNNEKDVAIGNNGEIKAGASFSDKYTLQFKSVKKILTFYVKDKSGNIVDKKTLDFDAKISY